MEFAQGLTLVFVRSLAQVLAWVLARRLDQGLA